MPATAGCGTARGTPAPPAPAIAKPVAGHAPRHRQTRSADRLCRSPRNLCAQMLRLSSSARVCSPARGRLRSGECPSCAGYRYHPPATESPALRGMWAEGRAGSGSPVAGAVADEIRVSARAQYLHISAPASPSAQPSPRTAQTPPTAGSLCLARWAEPLCARACPLQWRLPLALAGGNVAHLQIARLM